MQNIVEKQILRQIEGETIIQVRFTDESPAFISLIAQDGRFWIKPAFCKAKEVSREYVDSLIAQFTGMQRFNTDPEIIESGVGYNEWFDQNYNKI